MSYPSDFVTLQYEVINNLRLDISADLSKVKDWINRSYADTVVETEALQDYATMTLTANQDVYTLDTDIIRIKQMFVTPASGGGATAPLIPTSLEQILEWSAANGATSANGGTVTHYALLGVTNVQFYPVPSAADVITTYYVKLPTFLSADADVPVIQEPYATECLVQGACFRAAVFLKDPDAPLFKQQFDESVSKFRGHLRRREGSMTRQFRLTRGDTLTPHDPSVDVVRYG